MKKALVWDANTARWL